MKKHLYSLLYQKLSSLVLLLFASSLSFAQTFVFDGITYEITSPTTVEIATNQGSYAGDIQIPSIVIDNSNTYAVTSIGNYAFNNCSGLTSISIPNSVTSIGEQAFYACSALTSVTIPNSVTSIGQYAFSNCSGLTSVTISNSVTSIQPYTFKNCFSLSSIVIPNSVTSVGTESFKDCFAMSTISIPNSVTSIGEQAFKVGNNVTSITVNIANPLAISASMFDGTYNAILNVPKGSKAAYQAADYWKNFTNMVEFCSASASTITKSACDSYVFGTKTLTVSGTYKDTIPNAAGCDSVRTLNLTINITPSAPYVMQPDAVCDSGSFMLSAVPNVGRINCRECGDDNVYLWKNAAGDSVFNDADFQTPMIYGYYEYTVTANNNGCISEPTTVVLNVNQTNLPLVDNITICEGNTATFNASYFVPSRIQNARKSGIGAEFIWYTAAGDSILKAESFETNALTENTTFKVKAKVDGCYSDFDTVMAYVTQKPMITDEIDELVLCKNTLAKFKVIASGDSLTYAWGAKFENVWEIENGETKDSVKFNADAELNGFEIFTIVSNRCGMDTSIAILNVNVVDTAVSVSNGTITANLEGEEYQWINADNKTIIDGATERSFTPTQTGNYAVVLNEYYGKGKFCTDTSGVRYVQVMLTGLETKSLTNFNIYPNPAFDNVTITLTESVSGTVSIIDLNGNILNTKSISGNVASISTADLASGVYVVRINSDKGVAVKQLVVQ